MIEEPSGRGRNYGEYLAEKNGKPTNRGLIRRDIDRAIKASMTEREFYHQLEIMGYGVLYTVLKDRDANDGSMFCDLELYSDPAFCMDHPVIRFDTLTSFGEYEVIAVFRYNTNQETFRYDREVIMDEGRFSWFIEQVHARELFSTGKDASFGDQLLTLSTCEYTYKNGRLVVVARKVVQ